MGSQITIAKYIAMHQDVNSLDLEHDSEGNSINYRGLALEICDDLHDDDMESLKFLSRDFISGARLERINNPTDLLLLWEKGGKFGSDNPWFFAECLDKIQRLDLLEVLGIEESVLEQRVQGGKSQVSDYRKMLLEVAEDLDSDELHKMLYFIGDMKKKDKQKIKNCMDLFSYLEQIKQMTKDNLSKLKEILSSLDRNDLVEIVESYEENVQVGECHGKADPMDTGDEATGCKGASASTSAAAAAAATMSVQGAEDEFKSIHPTPSAVLSASIQRARNQNSTAPRPSPSIPNEMSGMLKDVADQVSSELNSDEWMIFANQMQIEPEVLERLSRECPDISQRTYKLLTLCMSRQPGGYDSVIKCVISGLHEAQVSQLADRLSMAYGSSSSGSDDISLQTGSSVPGSNVRHENISVTSNEATYRPENFLPVPVPEPEAVASPVAEVATIIPYYKMDASPRGICFVINNEIFHKDPQDSVAREMPNREGTRVDAERLRETFTKLDFVVIQHDNLKSTQMIREAMKLALDVDHRSYTCFVCCILTHGTQGQVYGTDGRLVQITDLTGPFKSCVCPTLANKPKLFFIQACQGRQKQEGHDIEQDGAVVEVDGMPTEVIPNESDFLIGYATVPGFVSYRSRSQGSWYITKLCEMLNKYGTEQDLLNVLLMVNSEVSRANASMEGGRFKQSPAPLFTLRKKVCFK